MLRNFNCSGFKISKIFAVLSVCLPMRVYCVARVFIYVSSVEFIFKPIKLEFCDISTAKVFLIKLRNITAKTTILSIYRCLSHDVHISHVSIIIVNNGNLQRKLFVKMVLVQLVLIRWWFALFVFVALLIKGLYNFRFQKQMKLNLCLNRILWTTLTLHHETQSNCMVATVDFFEFDFNHFCSTLISMWLMNVGFQMLELQ